MRRVVVGLTLTLLALRATPSLEQAQEKPASEKQKIEALIKHVEDMKDAKFVRNDKEYDAKTSARFLRGKWEANETDIKTAKDFIERAASTSSTTGKPYMIQLKDGKQMKCAEYLGAELKKLEKSSSNKRDPPGGQKGRRIDNLVGPSRASATPGEMRPSPRPAIFEHRRRLSFTSRTLPHDGRPIVAPAPRFSPTPSYAHEMPPQQCANPAEQAA